VSVLPNGTFNIIALTHLALLTKKH
jgi:hypothetical protein